MIELNTEQRRTMLKYAANSKGCVEVFCKTCSLCFKLSNGDPSYCMISDLYSGSLSITNAAQMYIKDHPEEFTPEELVEILL